MFLFCYANFDDGKYRVASETQKNREGINKTRIINQVWFIKTAKDQDFFNNRILTRFII